MTYGGGGRNRRVSRWLVTRFLFEISVGSELTVIAAMLTLVGFSVK